MRLGHCGGCALSTCCGLSAAAALWSFCSLFEGGGRGFVPAAEALFFVSPKKSTPKKGDPKSGPLRGSLRCSRQGGPAKLAALKQTRALIHLSLRCSALPHGASGIGCGRACEGTGEIARVGASSGAGVDLFEIQGRAHALHRAAKQPRPPIETTRRRCAAAAVGSPFFAYFLWRDKESEAPAGAQSRPPPSNKRQEQKSEAAPQTARSLNPVTPETPPC